MYQRSGFPIIITVVVFVLNWSPEFTVEGVPDRLEQCRQRGFRVACEYNTKINPCEVLTCGYRESIDYISQKIIVREGIPDGTACGPSKICRNKKCVHAAEGMPQCPEENNLQSCKARYTTTTSPIKTREQQCQDYGFDVACRDLKRSTVGNCRDLLCGYATSDGGYVRRRSSYLPFRLLPTSGTWCDVDKACYKRSCIPLSEWPPSVPIPTYTRCESFWPCNLTRI